MAGKRSVRKNPPEKWRTVFFFLFLFLALAVIVSVISPPLGFMEIVGTYLGNSLGFMVLFVPVFFFLAGSRVLRLNFAGKWLRRMGAVFLCSFFFSAMISLILCRIKADYLFLAGGDLTGRVVLAVQGLVGGVIGWVGLFSLFMISVVVFTGWDISGDINSLIGRFRTAGPGRKPRKKRQVTSDDQKPSFMEAQQDPANPWTTQSIPAETVVKETESVQHPVETAVKEILPKKEKKKPVPPVDIKQDAKPATVKKKPATAKNKPAAKTTKRAQASSDYVTGDQYDLPGADFLSLPADGERRGQSLAEIDERAKLLVSKLADFGVECTVADSRSG
ncbi:MAG: hypothetical protein KAH31_09450, partial [Candidatus Sabulitectum sp.]|nr:hypothetical protein [Candidatus Sabulitectum sp.]